MKYQRSPRTGRESEKGTPTMYTTIVTYLQARLNVDSERGAALVEYALLLALIAVACIVALNALGGGASEKFDDIANSISGA